jgi:hypothetical protein
MLSGLREEFEVSAEQAAGDLAEFLRALQKAGLVVKG